MAFLSGEFAGREEASRIRLARSEAVRERDMIGTLLGRKGSNNPFPKIGPLLRKGRGALQPPPPRNLQILLYQRS
jgi:hypothetical protein